MTYTQWIRLACECGFQTEIVEVGRLDESWIVASASVENGRLVLTTAEHQIPIDEVLKNRTVAWLCRQVLPTYHKIYGHCFVFTTRTPTPTELPCPLCQQVTLMLKRVA